MDRPSTCIVCGARLDDGQLCSDYFDLILFWELDYLLYDVHHLAVLSYYLQHPEKYSPKGLQGAMLQLVDFVEKGVTPQQMRQRIAKSVASDVRTYKIAGTPARYGVYQHPLVWQMRVSDVVLGGIDNYYASVRHWAAGILSTLRQSGNLG
jgi:hypothetical protein